jgi:hypothetical protein
MANESLVISITADQKAALAGLKQLNDQLLQLEKALKKTTDTAGIIKLQDQIRGLKTEMSSLNEVAQGKLVKGTNQAANALTNLGRVAQDAPYGFIGIQNNLNPLLESFQRLKQETGSTKTALSALVSGLAGPAGLGIALSVGSALLLTFGDRLFKVNKETEQATKDNKAFTDSLAKEQTQLKIVYDTATNVNQSMQIRIQAVGELRSNYGAYLKNFTDEEIIAGKAAKAYENLANAILMKARANAAQDKIQKIVSDNLEAELSIAETMAKANKAASNVKGSITTSGGTGGAAIITAANQIQGIWGTATAAVKEYSNVIKKNQPTLDYLNNLVQNNQALNFTSKSVTAKGGSSRGGAMAKDTYGNDYKPFNGGRNQQTVMPERESLDVLNVKLQKSQQYNEILATQLNLQTQFNEQQLVANQLSEIGASLFTSMGNALLYGQDMGEAFANTLKKIVMDLAAAVAQALIFQAIMSAINPAGAVAGVAGASSGGGVGIVGNLFGMISGNNILLSNNRTQTSMGLRR